MMDSQRHRWWGAVAPLGATALVAGVALLVACGPGPQEAVYHVVCRKQKG